MFLYFRLLSAKRGRPASLHASPMHFYLLPYGFVCGLRGDRKRPLFLMACAYRKSIQKSCDEFVKKAEDFES